MASNSSFCFSIVKNSDKLAHVHAVPILSRIRSILDMAQPGPGHTAAWLPKIFTVPALQKEILLSQLWTLTPTQSFSNWLEIRPDTWQTNSAYRAPRGAKQKDIIPVFSLADNVVISAVTFLLIKNFLNDVLSMYQETEFLMIFKEVIESFILWGIGKFLNHFLLVPSQHRPWRLTFEIPWSLSQTCSFGRQALFQHPFTSSWVTFQIISS